MRRSDRTHPTHPEAAQVLAVLREALSAEQDLDFAYLFGSVAKGRTRKASDVDVAVHLRGFESPSGRLDRALELEGALERLLERAVQVVVLNDAPLGLRFNVLAHGILVCRPHPSVHRAFYVDTGQRHYDMAYAREVFARAQKRRIEEGTFGS